MDLLQKKNKNIFRYIKLDSVEDLAFTLQKLQK